MLLLLIVKHEGSIEIPDVSSHIVERYAAAVAIVFEQKVQKTALEEKLDSSEVQLDALQSQIVANDAVSEQQFDELQNQLSALLAAREALSKSESEIQELQNELAAAVEKSTEPTVAQEGSLIGISILENRVLVLLDRSASMLAENLVDILRLRASSPFLKANAEKWQNARHIARWVVAQLDENAQYQLLTFSDKVNSIDNVELSGVDPGWLRKDQQTDPSMITKLNQITLPHGPTNLYEAFEVAAELRPYPNQIVLITDGLPTQYSGRALRLPSECHRDLASAKPVIVSPRCRAQIFAEAAKLAASKFKNTKIDVVLLNLEGDANAVFHYWYFTRRHVGRVLVPARGWPYS